MTARERTAWLMSVILAAAYGWYLVDTDPFWVANILLAALVSGELASFGLQIVQYRTSHP